MEGGNPQQSPQQGAPPNRQQNPYARYPQGQQGQQMGHPQYGGMAPHGQQAPPHSGRPGPQAGAPYGTSPGTAYPAGYVPGTSFQPQMAYAGQQGYYYPPQQMAGYVYMPPPGAYPQAATTGQAARPPPKRERKAIAIIDPTTNEEVKIEGVDKKERKVSVSEDAEKKGDESKKKEEDEKKKKEEEEKKKKDEEEKKKKEEEERKKKEEEEERLRKEKEEEERKKKEEEERLRAEEKKKEEEERLRQEEEERKKKEEEEARLKQEEEDRKKEEEERLKAEEQEKKKEEEERAKQEEEEKKKKEEEERKKKEEEEKARKEKEAEENKKKDEELRKQLEELEDGEIVDSADEPPRKKRAINVVYPADCWSPTHTSGKKWYPIDLLLQFKDVCLTAPADAVLPQDLLPGGRPPSTSSRGGAGGSRGGRPNPRAPSQDGRGGDYGQMVYQQPPGGRGPVQRQQSGGMRGGGRQGGRGGREGSRDGRRQQQQGSQPILPDESIEPIPVSGENAWKPRAAVDVNALDEEKRKEVEDENLFRKMKSLLNKLTLDKFEKLCGQIMALEINTPRRMEGCIVLVFDKALDEPGFASMYADLCKRLSTLEVKVPETPGQSDAEKKKKEYNFRRLLLNKCQVEFEKERDIPPRQEGVAAEDEDIKVVRARLRMFGNIKFIGELFKRHMLTEKIMHECVKQLLSADKRAGNDKKLPSEEAIECLTKLLSTVGKMLDRPEAKSHMDAYFQRLGELAKQKDAFPSRIRFLIQEVIDLRHQNWIPRRADNTPKTIEEVHRQAALDAQKAAAQSQQAQAAYQHGGGYGRTNSQGGRGGGQFGGFRGGPPQQQQNPDGWNTVGNRQNTRADLQALRNARSVSSDGRQAEGASPSLGPGGRLGGPGMWAAHAQQAAAKPNALGQRGTVGGAGPSMGGGGFTKNSFAMLHQEEDDDHGDMGQRSRSRDNREGEQTSSPALGAGWRPTLSGFKPTAPSKATPPVTPTIPKKSESGAGPRAMQGAEKDKAAGPQLSKEEFVRKLKGMVEQYASIKDITEARQDLKDMGTVSLHSLLVEKMVGDYLENKKVRPGAADLLAIFVRDGSISKQDFYAGLDAHVEFLEDLEVDVPKIYDYLAEYVGPLVADGTITLLDLTENLKHLETLRSMPCEGAAKLLAAILRYVAEKQGADKAKELWVASGLNLAKFLEDGRQEEADVSDFAKSKKIEFILA
eukprot:comp22798_c0_seq2/m.35745 comp22798_c0_seq2/g.35745  ORF comp22798_c0_seq2/g.35745 comp22798_c0_seq2/m.35745 type:complete len:1210 (-) comp22798_c0_seq2:692-4321(-)